VVVSWRCIAASLSSIAETNSFTPAGERVAGAIAAAWACADPRTPVAPARPDWASACPAEAALLAWPSIP
jgi:hypothetical protein